jgi:hypothetical protein
MEHHVKDYPNQNSPHEQHEETFLASELIDLSKSNRAILAAYNNFMSTLAACGASAPLADSPEETSSPVVPG